MVAINTVEAAHLAPTSSSGLIWLGIALVVLALSASVVFWWLRSSASRSGAERLAAEALPMVCPGCQRSYPAGTTFCAVDACRLVSDAATSPQGERQLASGKCPRCRRVYEAGQRFCAVDAEELVPLSLWHATHPEGGQHVDETVEADAGQGARAFAAAHFHGDGKICPQCAEHYNLEASFCGRDGAELVAIN